MASKKKESKGRVFVDEELCKGCGFCVEFCPPKVLILSSRFNAKGYHPPEEVEQGCTGCDICGLLCPDFAIFSMKFKDLKKMEDEGAA